MGIYVNPRDVSKEEFLGIYGEMMKEAPDHFMRTNENGKEQYAVCWVDNGWMTAAGICFNENELAAFKCPDQRPKRWFWVDKKRLGEFM